MTDAEGSVLAGAGATSSGGSTRADDGSAPGQRHALTLTCRTSPGAVVVSVPRRPRCTR
ncbi:hypothetical protein NKG05_08280 [Oerskovia sp. M15]